MPFRLRPSRILQALSIAPPSEAGRSTTGRLTSTSEAHQPLVTLHGHVHESARLTGLWREKAGLTLMLSAAHDRPELALVRVDFDQPEAASRHLL